jgi:hypothetical protein
VRLHSRGGYGAPRVASSAARARHEAGAGAAARAACAHAGPLAGRRCTRRAHAGLLRGVHSRGRCGTIACALPLRKGVLPKDYARPGLGKQRFGQLLNLVSDIGLGKQADRAKDILGRVYEYFLAQLPPPRGRRAGSSILPRASCACWWKFWPLTAATLQ